MKLTKSKLKEIIREEIQSLSEATYYRLEGKANINDFYWAKRNLEALYSRIEQGNDFDKDEFDKTLKHCRNYQNLQRNLMRKEK